MKPRLSTSPRVAVESPESGNPVLATLLRAGIALGTAMTLLSGCGADQVQETNICIASLDNIADLMARATQYIDNPDIYTLAQVDEAIMAIRDALKRNERNCKYSDNENPEIKKRLARIEAERFELAQAAIEARDSLQ